jgi:MFS superfamily sulfate permease-like transporter
MGNKEATSANFLKNNFINNTQVDKGGLKFNLRELGGALGDFGPLHPLFLAYVKILNLDPAAIMLVMGISNILIGIYYKLPLPIEPMKAIAIYALTYKWDINLIYATSFGMAIIWLVLSITGLLDKILWIVPECVARGIQLALAIYLLLESIELMQTSILLSLLSIAIIALFITIRKRKFVPATIVLYGIGLFIALQNEGIVTLSFYIPKMHLFTVNDVWKGMLEVGFVQIFLTLSNAVIATRIAVNERFSRKIKDGQLALNMGLMNFLAAFFGCIPLCHGAGGFMAQYFYGARTGGAMVMEGLIEIISAIFLSTIVVWIFSRFPIAIVGAMLIPASIELGKEILKLKKRIELIIALLIAIISYLTNLSIGFIIGIMIYYILKNLKINKD